MAISGGVVITHEDIDRAHDRDRVSETRARRGPWSRARLLWLLVGPGILVMLGENDGPSMLSYAATGARFGLGFFLPFVVLTFVMACVVQEMTVRLGAATHRGHAELIFDRFGPFWGWFSMADLMVGNFLTLVTEFIAIRAGLGFFGVPPAISVLGAWLVLFVALMAHRYWTWERITLVAAMFNLVFIPVALLTHPHWGAIGSALITWGPRPGLTPGNRHHSALQHRRDRHPLDALLPAKRHRRQGPHHARHPLRPHRHHARRDLAALAALATIIVHRPALRARHVHRKFRSRRVRPSPSTLRRPLGRSIVRARECLKPAWSLL
jgi:hypothetical protein